MCQFVSPYVGMGSHVRKGVRVHDMHYKPKSYKLNKIGSLTHILCCKRLLRLMPQGEALQASLETITSIKVIEA